MGWCPQGALTAHAERCSVHGGSALLTRVGRTRSGAQSMMDSTRRLGNNLKINLERVGEDGVYAVGTGMCSVVVLSLAGDVFNSP